MSNTPVKKGELFFLWHPGSVFTFSGYGLAVAPGSPKRLVGLLMVDRPKPVSEEWLRTIASTYGSYELYEMVVSSERGIACQMWIEDGSLPYLRQAHNTVGRAIQAALLPFLLSPPKPQLDLRWDTTTGLWRSTLHEVTPEEKAAGQQGSAPQPLFSLGQVVATPGALAALQEAGQLPQEFLHRHITGDWGDLDEHDLRQNEEALHHGNRLLSAYRTDKGTRLWVITEWDRSVTTLLLPSEY